LRSLPDGVFIVWQNEYWLLHNGTLHLWTPAGYTERRDLFDGPVSVLTPRSTVDTIQAGYRPGVHRSAVEPHRLGGMTATLSGPRRLPDHEVVLDQFVE
jgi:hypothetical protein